MQHEHSTPTPSNPFLVNTDNGWEVNPCYIRAWVRLESGAVLMLAPGEVHDIPGVAWETRRTGPDGVSGERWEIEPRNLSVWRMRELNTMTVCEEGQRVFGDVQ